MDEENSMRGLGVLSEKGDTQSLPLRKVRSAENLVEFKKYNTLSAISRKVREKYDTQSLCEKSYPGIASPENVSYGENAPEMQYFDSESESECTSVSTNKSSNLPRNFHSRSKMDQTRMDSYGENALEMQYFDSESESECTSVSTNKSLNLTGNFHSRSEMDQTRMDSSIISTGNSAYSNSVQKFFHTNSVTTHLVSDDECSEISELSEISLTKRFLAQLHGNMKLRSGKKTVKEGSATSNSDISSGQHSINQSKHKDQSTNSVLPLTLQNVDNLSAASVTSNSNLSYNSHTPITKPLEILPGDFSEDVSSMYESSYRHVITQEDGDDKDEEIVDHKSSSTPSQGKHQGQLLNCLCGSHSKLEIILVCVILTSALSLVTLVSMLLLS